jgi:HK97 family phage portal protein
MIKELFQKFFPRQQMGQPEPQSHVIKDQSVGVSSLPVPFNVPSLFAIYKSNSWVYTAINMMVSSCVAVPLKIRGRATKAIISPTESERIGAVLKYPNPFMTQFELLELLFLHLEICGNAFWELVTDENKNLIAIFPLHPPSMEITPDPKRKIRNYTYTADSQETIFKVDDIVHFKYPNPDNEYWGLAPSLLMRRKAMLESKVDTFCEKFFDNDATPGGYLKTDRILSDPTYNRLRKRWLERHGGVANKFSLAILEDGMSFEPSGSQIAEADTSSIKNSIRDEIMIGFGVPPTLVGLSEANYASGRIIQAMFFDGQIAPRLRRVASCIDKDIMNRFDRNNESVFDTSVSPINIAKLSANSRVVARLYTLNLMKKNEARNLLGLSPVEDGNMYYTQDTSRKSPAPDDSGSTSSGEADTIEGGDAGADAEGGAGSGA